MSTQNPKSKTYVSFLGGCAGDMITACLNSIHIMLNPQGYVASMDFSLKLYEPLRDMSHLIGISKEKTYQFLSTHEFDLLQQGDLNWINIVVTDPMIQEILILRQMSLQNLRIEVDETSHWYRVVKTFCLKDKHDLAAKYWLSRARTIWLDNMHRRLDLSGPRAVVDNLFDKGFVTTLQQKWPAMDPVVAHANHVRWLSYNPVHRWTVDNTVAAMVDRLRLMDWNQSSGVIHSTRSSTA